MLLMGKPRTSTQIDTTCESTISKSIIIEMEIEKSKVGKFRIRAETHSMESQKEPKGSRGCIFVEHP